MEKNLLTILIFGATGDLFQKKLSKAFFGLQRLGFLPRDFVVYGFSRKSISDLDFREMARKSILKDNDPKEEDLDNFLSRFFYFSADITKPATYEKIKDILAKRDNDLGVCSDKLYYLSVRPDLYEEVFMNISRSGLCLPCGRSVAGQSGAWIKILVEKPFGGNPIEAEHLDSLLGSLFSEEQIFRIDHYLAKETSQNIIAFRFANSIFEPLWSRDRIEKITVRILETNDASARGALYNSLGALKDVGQNHALQMLALCAMERPKNLTAAAVRKSRANFFKSLYFAPEVGALLRGQYEGFAGEAGVLGMSETETYFKAHLQSSSPRWKGVPFVIEAGKALDETKAEIEVAFKDETAYDWFPQSANKLIFHIQPKEGITIEFWAKKSGFQHEVERKDLSFNYQSSHASPFIYPYEKLLVDALSGDQSLFVSTDELKEEWRVVGDMLKFMPEIPLVIYKKGSSSEEISGS